MSLLQYVLHSCYIDNSPAFLDCIYIYIYIYIYIFDVLLFMDTNTYADIKWQNIASTEVNLSNYSRCNANKTSRQFRKVAIFLAVQIRKWFQSTNLLNFVTTKFLRTKNFL